MTGINAGDIAEGRRATKAFAFVWPFLFWCSESQERRDSPPSLLEPADAT